MSRPAFKPVRQRTTDCSTCKATKYHPCWRLDASKGENGWHVGPHAARLRAEAALRRESQ